MIDFGKGLIMAIDYGYNYFMKVSTADAKNRLTELIRAVEAGKSVVITRHGKPVAQIAPAPQETRRARLGGMKDRVRLLPGWDKPIDLDRFLKGDV
ncbi:MAG TPA: type II toxin-antitoxin system prevent-host-death family antitoxin [Terracidiphilus sp.]|nr:type II toxin-antitoxin system prevent-host-death family antitoxin [Terracidiphilus sp.]